MKPLLLLALLAVVPAAAQPDAAARTGCVAGNCTDGTGTFVHASGATYVGAFAGGRRHGIGSFTYSDGNRYVGGFADGRMEGDGVYTFAGGATWRGTWHEREGTAGVLTDSTGREVRRGPFPGYWAGERGFRCTEGTCTTGAGTGLWPDSTRYTGGWRDGIREGAGRSVLRQTTEEGTFADGRLSGTGRERYADGDVYTGPFTAGLRDGDGVWTFADGVTWAGRFERGRATGDGLWRDAAGGVYARGPYADSPPDRPAATTGAVPGGVRTTVERGADGSVRATISTGDPALEELLRNRP